MEKGQGLQCRISQLGFASRKKKKKKGKSTVELCSDVRISNFSFKDMGGFKQIISPASKIKLWIEENAVMVPKKKYCLKRLDKQMGDHSNLF